MPKPFLRWVGGKRQLLSEIRNHIPDFIGNYFEPFMGGAALFWELLPPHARLSDLNEHLVRTYTAVQQQPKQVIHLLKTYPNDKEFFLWFRTLTPTAWDDAEVAAWFIYLNKTCFNGIYRVNKKGVFNVPFGQLKNPLICDEQTIIECSKALEGVMLNHAPFYSVLDEAVRGDFVYFDPPYVPLSETSSFTSYTTDGFSNEDQVNLRDVALQLKEWGVHVLLSNSAAPAVYELYSKGFTIKEVKASRNVSASTEGREKVNEVLIW